MLTTRILGKHRFIRASLRALHLVILAGTIFFLFPSLLLKLLKSKVFSLNLVKGN